MPPKKRLNPAELVVARFGGSRKASRMLGFKTEQAVSRWLNNPGGRIPNGYGAHEKVLTVAKREGIPFTVDELYRGGYENGADK
jgi:hypothetical protein